MGHRASSALTGASAPNAAVPVPAGAAIGDIAVVGLYMESAAAVTPPAGFTLKSSLQTSPTARGRLDVFWKRLAAADSGTYTFTHASTFRAAACGLWSGRIATGDPFDGTVGTAESTAAVNVLNVSTSPAAASGDAVGFWTNFNGGTTFGAPASYTQRQSVSSVICLETRDAVAAGSTGSVTASSTISDFEKAFLGVLAPAASGNNTATTAATETDTGTAIASTRATATGVAPETDTGQAVGRTRQTAVTPATETDTGQAAGRTRATSTAPAAETDTGQAVASTRATPVGTATETDTGVPITAPGGTPVTPAAELDTGVTIGRTRGTAATPAPEVDTGTPVGRTRGTATGTAGETDIGTTVARTRATPVTPALEVDQGVSLFVPTLDLLLSGYVETDRLIGSVDKQWHSEVEADPWLAEVER